MSSPSYHYVFAGTGAAALSLLLRLQDAQLLQGKRVLLLDRSRKTDNDRTWCFWEKGEGYFEKIIHKRWEKLAFLTEGESRELAMGTYVYKMIRGIDFYEYCLKRLQSLPNLEWKYGELEWKDGDNNTRQLYCEGQPVDCTGALVFNSLAPAPQITPDNLALLQHFKGWILQTERTIFDAGKGLLMDFRVPQTAGTTFVYVLPLSANKALVEFTVFSKQLLSAQAYEAGLKSYWAQHFGNEPYRIVEEEFGIIPMTAQPYPQPVNGIVQIGTAGGQTKASTGYTFQFIQKQSAQIVAALQEEQPVPAVLKAPRRFQFYDRVLLQLLVEGRLPGKEIFTRLFHRNPAHQIFQFLDNETSLPAELSLISRLQFWPFLRAAWRTL